MARPEATRSFHRTLLDAIERAAAPDRRLDALIQCQLAQDGFGTFSSAEAWADTAVRERWNVPAFTRVRDDVVVWLLQKKLESFYHTSGLCALSGHASIGPDYNGPDGARLRKRWPEDRFHAGFHADLEPGGEPFRETMALLHTCVQALEAQWAMENADLLSPDPI